MQQRQLRRSRSNRLGIRIRVTTCGALFALTITVVGQQATPQEPTATFRSAIEAVEIDAFVTDANGDPVPGLAARDFELFENGRQVPITTFRAIDIPIERTESIENDPVESDVAANNGPEGRIYLFALDEVQAKNALRTRRFLREFIEHRFGANDLGAVVLTGRGLADSGQDFTSNKRLLLDAVDRFSGGFAFEAGPAAGTALAGEPCRGADKKPGDVYKGVRSQQILSLSSLAQLMARMPGRHKAMLFFTECIAADALDLVDYHGGVLGMMGEDAHGALSAMTRSNLAVYPINPAGLSLEESDYSPLETLDAFRALANATGGVALINSNNVDSIYERIVRDNSTYYMLGFNSAYDRNDGRYVRLDVKARRPGLTVRARAGYVAPTRRERRERERAQARATRPATAASALLASPISTDGIPVIVSAVPFKTGNDAHVAIVVELQASTLGLVPREGAYRGAVEVAFSATDARRNIYPEVRHTATVVAKSSGQEAGSLDAVRLRMVFETRLQQGRYQLRVGAAAAARTGGVVYDLEVPDFGDGPLSMSGVALVDAAERQVLTLRSTGRPTTPKPVKCYTERCTPPPALTQPVAIADAGAPLLDNRIPGPPTTRRDFSRDDHIMLVAEVYDNKAPSRATDDRPVTLTVSLRDRASDRVISLASHVSPAPRSQSGGHAFGIQLPLDSVPPGEYVMQVEAQAGDTAAPSVRRRIPMTVK